MTGFIVSILRLVLYVFLPGFVIKAISWLRHQYQKRAEKNNAASSKDDLRQKQTETNTYLPDDASSSPPSNQYYNSSSFSFAKMNHRSHSPSKASQATTFWLETKWDTIARLFAASIALYYTFLFIQPFVPFSMPLFSPTSTSASLSSVGTATNFFGPTLSTKDIFGGRDLFQLVHADYNVQAWQLRNAVRDFKKAKARHDEIFNQQLKKEAEAIVPDEEDDNDRIVGADTSASSSSSFSTMKNKDVYDFLSPVAKLDYVYERVKTTDNRKLYLLFGHDSFIRCQWCAEEVDYFMFHLTSVGLQYALAAALLGLMTAVRSRQGWRSWGILTILTLFISECGFYYLPVDYRTEIIHSFSPPPMRDQSIFFDDLVREHFVPVQHYLRAARYACLATLFLFIFLRKKGHEIPDTLLLERVTKSQQQFFARLQALHAAQEAIQRETTLRQRMAEVQRRRRDEDETFTSSPMIRQAVAFAREKLDMTQIEEDAALAADDVVSLGKRIATARTSTSSKNPKASKT